MEDSNEKPHLLSPNPPPHSQTIIVVSNFHFKVRNFKLGTTRKKYSYTDICHLNHYHLKTILNFHIAYGEKVLKVI